MNEPFPQRAAVVATNWNGSSTQQLWKSGYVPLQETTHLPPGVFHSGADKAAYLAGQFHVIAAVPSVQTEQTVRFDNGSTLTRPDIGALNALRSDGVGHCPSSSCPGWLTVTGVRATTERVQTSQGQATVPVWAFKIQGYQGEFVYAAVRPDDVPWDVPTLTLPGYQGASLISASPDGRTLTLGTSIGCGEGKPTGLVFETKESVVVGATDPKVSLPPGTACTASLAEVRLQVHLSGALAGRTVLNVANGAPEAPIN